MNEVIEQYAEKALGWLESGALWLQEEIPLYINEILRWEFARHMVFGIIGFILLFIAISLIIKTIRLFKKDESLVFMEDIESAWAVIGGGAFIPGFAIVISNLLYIIQIKVAPRVFLIEYFTGLLSQ